MRRGALILSNDICVIRGMTPCQTCHIGGRRVTPLRRTGISSLRAMSDADNALEAGKCFRLSQERLAQLRVNAHQRGLSVQTFLEWKVFGVVAPRQRNRRDARLVDQAGQDDLGFTLPTDREASDAA